jgi:hypothetical protein
MAIRIESLILDVIVSTSRGNIHSSGRNVGELTAQAPVVRSGSAQTATISAYDHSIDKNFGRKHNAS